MSKLIAVFGATGAQGGSVLKALINDSKYSVRAITRNKDSDKAKQLSQLNRVSLHQADLDNTSSVDKALNDCYGTFLVTDFMAHFENKETKQGVDLINSAIKNKLKHVVFSGLEHVQNIINKPCLHFDYKADVEDYGFKQADKINFTSIRLPAYYQVLPTMLSYKAGPNHFLLTFPMADKKLFCMNVEDTGECVRSIFNNSKRFKSQVVPVAGDKLTPKEIEDVLNKYLAPNKFTYANFSLEKFLTFGFKGVEDITNMFEYYQTDKMVRDIELTRSLNKSVLSFDQWVDKNRDYLNQILAQK